MIFGDADLLPRTPNDDHRFLAVAHGSATIAEMGAELRTRKMCKGKPTTVSSPCLKSGKVEVQVDVMM
jgi:hypothetical protein